MAVKHGLQISFEFFPPKTQEGKILLSETAQQLAKCNPAFFSVTFGAGGSTRKGTIETVKQLQEENKSIAIAPHLSCIGENRQDIIDIISFYQSSGVKRVIALRGDLPSGMGSASEFKFANELVKLIRNITGQHFHIEVAAYPEIHPQASSAVDDILNLKRKQDAGANSAITQFFFNSDAYFYYLDECVKQGIHIPIIPGIMPISQFSKLARFSEVCGAEIPRWIRKRLESYGDDIASIQAFGLEVVYHLCQSLLAGGVAGLHFYTLNKATLTYQLIKLLGLMESKKTDKLSA